MQVIERQGQDAEIGMVHHKDREVSFAVEKAFSDLRMRIGHMYSQLHPRDRANGEIAHLANDHPRTFGLGPFEKKEPGDRQNQHNADDREPPRYSYSPKLQDAGCVAEVLVYFNRCFCSI